MRTVSSTLLYSCLAFLTGCAAVGRGRGAPQLTGSYSARLVITGRSTYTGTFTISRWTRDSAYGTLRLVAPVGVEVAARGQQRADTLHLLGTYSAANGCTGSMTAALLVSTGAARAVGPVTLDDKCVGALPGTMEISR